MSKQTVYKQFADKEQLCREIVLGVTANSEAIISELTASLRAGEAATHEQLHAALTDLARRYIDGVLQTHVLSLRRLVIAEPERFPDLAHAYFEHAPARGIAVIAEGLRTYADLGLLTVDDLELAASHFAYLALAIPQDRAYFYPNDPPGRAERDRLAAAAARVFLAAYATPKQG